VAAQHRQRLRQCRADQATYTLGDADVGGTVRVVVSYVDQQGTAEAVTSAATAAIAAVNDPHTGGASITGTATENQVLTAVSTLADVDGLGTLHYQWQHNVARLRQCRRRPGDLHPGRRRRRRRGPGGGQLHRRPGLRGVGDQRLHGGDRQRQRRPDRRRDDHGTANENQVLTANTSTLADADGLGTLHYQWQRDSGSGFVNVGTDQSTYTLTAADVGAVSGW
jgi:hypothetical protein